LHELYNNVEFFATLCLLMLLLYAFIKMDDD